MLFVSVLIGIAITSLGEERAGLCSSRASVRLFFPRQFLSFFLFLLVSGVGCGFFFFIVALPLAFLLTFLQTEKMAAL